MIEYAEETKASYFDGFKLPESGTSYEIAMPANWPDIAKAIDNLAELKVVQMVLWVTWGNGRPDGLESLTIDDFMECTGLSKQSVRTGIEKALLHGYIVRQIEYFVEDGNIHQVRYYGLKLYQARDQDVDEGLEVSLSVETALEADCYEEQNVSLSTNNSNNIPTITCSNVIRIQSLETLPEKVYSNTTHRAKENYPAFIKAVLKYLSVELGDGEHIASNIAQATRIYKQSGLSEEDFTKLLYDLETVARSKRGIKRINSQGWPNRMPYFFSCLKKTVIVTNNC